MFYQNITLTFRDSTSLRKLFKNNLTKYFLYKMLEHGRTGIPIPAQPMGANAYTRTILLDAGPKHEHELRHQQTRYKLDHTLTS